MLVLSSLSLPLSVCLRLSLSLSPSLSLPPSLPPPLSLCLSLSLCVCLSRSLSLSLYVSLYFSLSFGEFLACMLCGTPCGPLLVRACVLVLSPQDITDPAKIAADELCERSVTLYGYVRGAYLKSSMAVSATVGPP